MESYAPDLSQFWLPLPDAASDVADAPNEGGLTPADERALAELEERVSAARRIV